MFRNTGPILAILLFHLSLQAQQVEGSERDIEVGTIVVTANREAIPQEKLGSTVTVITAETIANAGYQYVADALRDVPGLDVVGSGGAGKITSVFMRGAESGHTLVLLDGIELNDPISAGNLFDFAHMSVANIERIEIVRGPQSTVHGSDAMAGVIQIFTSQGRRKSHKDFSLGLGSFGTTQQTAQINGTKANWRYSVAGENFDQDGFSSANQRDGNREKDPYRNTTLHANLAYDRNPSWSLGLMGRATRTTSHLDNGGGEGKDDPNNIAKGQRTYLRGFARFNHADQRWHQELGLGFTRNKRDLNNESDDAHPVSASQSSYTGERMKIDWRHTVIPNQRHTLTLGLESEREKGNSQYRSQSSFGPYCSIFPQKTANTNGLYLQDFFQVNDDLAITLGARLDDHDRFGSHTTYRTTFSQSIANGATSLRGSYGTSFKSPSLFQLYSSYGSQDLKAEKNTGWDLGLSHVTNQISMQLAWFDNRFQQLIDYDNNLSVYNNIARADTHGLETSLQWQVNSWFNLGFQYTQTQTRDGITGQTLLRRPKHKGQVHIAVKLPADAGLNLYVRYVGERDFNDYSTFPRSRVSLNDFTLLHLSGQLPLGSRFGLGARVENVTDRDYEEVLGYGTPGASGFLSLSYTH